MKLPEIHLFKSKDGRRLAEYAPTGAGELLPDGLQKAAAKKPIYRLIRTVRTRRGFGTIIHSLTTFAANKKKVHKSAAHWVRLTTNDR